jgi:hypothetical protein
VYDENPTNTAKTVGSFKSFNQAIHDSFELCLPPGPRYRYFDVVELYGLDSWLDSWLTIGVVGFAGLCETEHRCRVFSHKISRDYTYNFWRKMDARGLLARHRGSGNNQYLFRFILAERVLVGCF